MKAHILLLSLILLYGTIFGVNSVIQSMKADTWMEIPNSKMADDPACVTITEYPYLAGSNARNCQGAIGYWNGGTFDTKRNRLLIFGGGHAGWAGNEIYGFDLDDFSWVRISEPSAPTQCVNEYADGTPTSRHTYNHLAYIAHADRLLVPAGGARWCPQGQVARGNWTFDFTALTWHKMDSASYTGWENSCAVYDPGSGRVYLATGTSQSSAKGTWSYEFDNDRWTNLDPQSQVWQSKCGAVDTKRGLLVYVWADEMWVYDIGNNNNVPTKRSSGIGGALAKGALHYDPVTDLMVGWASDYVYTLNTETWEWTRMNAACPQSPAGPGTYGRFQYSPEENAYVLVNNASENVLIYKLTEGAGITHQLPGSGNNRSGIAISAQPNPFNLGTTIKVEGNGKWKNVDLKIYNIHGKMVKDFSSIYLLPYTLYLQAAGLSPGIYFAKLKSGNRIITQRLFLVK
jgi:hypothetical protein